MYLQYIPINLSRWFDLLVCDLKVSRLHPTQVLDRAKRDQDEPILLLNRTKVKREEEDTLICVRLKQLSLFASDSKRTNVSLGYLSVSDKPLCLCQTNVGVCLKH